MVCTSSGRDVDAANGGATNIPEELATVAANGGASVNGVDLLALKLASASSDDSTDSSSSDTTSTATAGAEQEEELLLPVAASDAASPEVERTINGNVTADNGFSAEESGGARVGRASALKKTGSVTSRAGDGADADTGNAITGSVAAGTGAGSTGNGHLFNGIEQSAAMARPVAAAITPTVVRSSVPSKVAATVRRDSCSEPTEKIRFAIGNGFWGSEDDNASMRSRANTGSVAVTGTVSVPVSAGGGDSDEYDLVPPDGGWGWMVLLGTVIVNTLIPGLVKSFGVLYVEFMEMFNATPSSVSWIPAITFSLYNLLGPVASVISMKVSCRFATCLGGISATVGLALSYFANSIEFLYFSYGILGGIGAGMSYTPGILIVGQYFDKRRGLANGICASGSALGSIILPPFLNYLLDQYGCRGAILIMCGVTLNVCVGAMLYQPVYRHLVKRPRPPPAAIDRGKDGMPNGGGVLIGTMSASKLEDIEEVPCGDDAKSFRNRRNDSSFASVTDCLSPVGSKRLLLRRPQSNPRFAQLLGSESRHASNGGGVMIGDEEQRVMLIRRDDLGSPTVAVPVSSYTASNGGLCMGSSSALGGVMAMHRSPSVVSNVSSASFAYLSTIHHGNTPAAYQLNTQIVVGMQRNSLSESRAGGLAAMTTSQSSIGRRTPRHMSVSGGGGGGSGAVVDGGVAPGQAQQPEKLSMCKMLFDVSLLHNTVFLLITYSVVASGIGYTNLLIILPAYAADLGLEKTYYARLLSVIAGTDLVGRIGGAWASDWARFPCKYLYASGFVVSGAALMLMTQLNWSFNALVSCCAIFGLASGVYIGLMAVLLVNQLGADKLASSFGLSLAINGVVMLGGPPIVGAIQEAIGSYEPVIFILGVIIMSGGLIMVLEPFASAYEKRKLDNLVMTDEATTVSV